MGKYTPEPRDYEDKEWLYEQYWGEMKTAAEVAEASDCDVSRSYIDRTLREYGIPTRGPGPREGASPFRGFYGDDAPTRGNGNQSDGGYDPEQAPDNDYQQGLWLAPQTE